MNASIHRKELHDATSESSYRELVEITRDLVPKLRARHKETDALAKLPESTLNDLKSAGLFDLLTPEMYGGKQLSLTQYMELVLEVSRGDASVGWAVSLTCICNWMIATMFPRSVTDKIFSTPGGTRIAGVFAPRVCKARRAAGGIVIEELFGSFSSGVYHANWELIGVPIFNEGGEVVDGGIAILPISDIEIVNDWDTIGIRGSGSASIRLKDVFVPDERIAPIPTAVRGEYLSTHLSEISLYRSAFVPALTMSLILPVLGAGNAGLEVFLASLPKRSIAFTPYAKQADATVTHLQVAEASAKIDAARLIVERGIADIEASATALTEGRGEYMDLMMRARMRRDAGFAAKLVWEAVDGLASAAGGSLAATHNPLNRIWHDVRVASCHAFLVATTNFELYGSMLCGKAPNTPIL